MLTKADDFPIHQTPEPIAYSGTDRNFYDRYFFNGYGPGGDDFFAVAFGVYPHLNVADAHFSVIRDGVQHCVHASKILHSERWDLEVGPIRIEVLEPLHRLRVTVQASDGIAAQVEFTGRAFPIEEPRFTHRIGPRAFMDYTRMTQNGRYSGWVEVDGDRRALAPLTLGTRDRSWGIRPIGAPDPQPPAPAIVPGFFWQWCPLNFAGESVFFHLTADADGHPWNTRAVICPDGVGPDGMLHASQPSLALTFPPGLRHAASASIDIPTPTRRVRIEMESLGTFLMRGIGYGHPEWRHGGLKGELAVAREDIDLVDLDRARPENNHIQELVRATLREDGRPDAIGIGVHEQMIRGPYKPFGFR